MGSQKGLACTFIVHKKNDPANASRHGEGPYVSPFWKPPLPQPLGRSDALLGQATNHLPHHPCPQSAGAARAADIK